MIYITLKLVNQNAVRIFGSDVMSKFPFLCDFESARLRFDDDVGVIFYHCFL